LFKIIFQLGDHLPNIPNINDVQVEQFNYVGKQYETSLTNWIGHNMCGDYHLVNKWTYLDKYAMPLLKEIFDALGQAKVFSTLD